MKRIHVVLVLAIAVVGLTLAPMANAARVPSMGTLELNAGYAKSSNDVTGGNEKMGGGLTFGAGYWRNASPQVSWGAELGFDNLGNAKYDNGTTTDNEISSKAFRVNPAVRFKFGAPVGPSFYAQGGAGLYRVSSDVKDSVIGNASASESKFGFNVGAGMSFPVGPKSRANLTGLYHSISTSGTSLNYLQFRAGIGFSL
ncbi:MAG TPA: outer membrane beta-barrel protein [Candidatus Limnocylindrales bacterium]|nr:outer membrane beta-barrel protein [Candidatus Limnocylindrales bacterium]